MSKKSKFPQIKAELRNRQAESGEIRKRIRAAHGVERYNLWNEKRCYGMATRDIILAYHFLRGRPYLSAERKCQDTNHPSVYSIQEQAQRFAPDRKITVEEIKAWRDAVPEQPKVQPQVAPAQVEARP